MKHPLGRVLRLRALMEELSQLEHERRSGEVRQLEMAAEGERARSRAARGDAVGRLTAGEVEWLLGFSDADLLAGKSGKLRLLAESKRPEAEAARSALRERRMERRQVETLVTEAAAEEATEAARREQKRIDDWFQSRAAWIDRARRRKSS
jgi:flagellar export protein FliJ